MGSRRQGGEGGQMSHVDGTLTIRRGRVPTHFAERPQNRRIAPPIAGAFKTKRPKMGHIASALSTKVIFTSDNPRNEEPEAILNDIEKGVEPQNFKKTLTITDRKQAIKTACQMAQPNDIVLIAGKGHETYQEIKGERFEFDDFKIAKKILKQLQK